jgi:hypothetical protein
MYLVDGELIKAPIPRDSHFRSIVEIVSSEELTTFGHFLGNPPFLKAFIVPSNNIECMEIIS